MNKAEALLYDGLLLALEQAIESKLLDEPRRARIHAMTRKVTMTDEDIYKLWRESFEKATSTEAPWEEIAMRDLRDRYEEKGKYAPEGVGTGSTPSPSVDGSMDSPAQK